MEVKTVAVIGAGISGLAFAHRLKELSAQTRQPLKTVLLESSQRAGGTIASESRDGFLLESGPDAFISEKPWALDLSRRLGIESQVIGTEPDHRRTFVAHRGKLCGLPEGFYLIAPKDIPAFMGTPLFSAKGKLRMLMETVIPRKFIGKDESVASFIRRRFGREALERVGQPMIAGIYSGDPEELSILHAMPRFKELESKHGSVILGLRKSSPRASRVLNQTRGPRYSLFLSFERGMETLTQALLDRIGPSSISYGSRTSILRFEAASSRWRILLDKGGTIEADAVCLAASAKTAAGLLRETAPKLFEKLGRISYESVATLNLAYKTSSVPHARNGFGFVVPALENRSLIACTFCDRKFRGRAPQEKVLLRVFTGGAFGRRFFEMEDADLLTAVRRDLRELMGIQDEPLFHSIRRYPEALPQYRVGHGDLISGIEKETASFKGLSLTGSSYRGTGIPDCVHDAEREAERTFESLFGLNSIWEKSTLPL